MGYSQKRSAAAEEPIGDSDAGPPVTIEFALPSAGDSAAEVREVVAETVLAYQRALSVPGRIEVTVDDAAPGQWRLQVNGRRLCCADDDVEAVVRDVTGGRTGDLADVAPYEVPATAAGLCVEALQTRLSVLLHPRHVPTVLARARAGAGAGVEEVGEALATVLDMGVPLDGEALARSLDSPAKTPHPIELAERLIDTGRSATLDILFAPATLRSVTSGAATNVFPKLREELYNERGVLGPNFHLAEDPGMARGTYAFRINGVRTRERPLPPGHGLPDVAAELGRHLRRRAGWFVSMQLVRKLSDRLALVLPDTVGAIRARYSPEWLTALARAAAEEGTSLRNLATILDRLLDIDVHPPNDLYLLREGCAPPATGGIETLPRPRDAVVLLRQRMREETSRVVALDVVRVHRLRPVLEERLVATAPAESPPGEDTDMVVDDVVAEVRRMVRMAPELPLVAPSLSLRSWLWEILRDYFPTLEVVALTEFPPGLDIVAVPVPVPVSVAGDG